MWSTSFVHAAASILAAANCTAIAAVAAPDRTPPAAVSTLAISGDVAGFVTLSWTAVGDDGGGGGACNGAGRATAYDLRYSTNAPGADANAWFAAAMQTAGEPAPNPCGMLETFCLPGLAAGPTYYFGLRVSDEASNISPVSNIIAGSPGTRTGSMHIASVNSNAYPAGGVKKRGVGRVEVVDALGAPVPCATVTGQWTGCYNDVASGVTDANGRAEVFSNRTASCPNTNCCFIFTVTDVSHPVFARDAGADVATSGRCNCNPFAPSACLALVALPRPADRNEHVEPADLAAFVNTWFTSLQSGTLAGDFDGDGVVTPGDAADFLTAWFAASATSYAGSGAILSIHSH